jgi:tetratricopeptide (TPR) repeat protein
MYFKNNTGEKELDHWRRMLSNLLIADLTQSKHIRILSEDKLFNILSQMNQLEEETYSSEVLEEVATQGGVNHILQGAYAKAGDEYRINVTLQEASTGELIGSESVEGRGEKSIFSMVDELTRKIKANFKLSPEAIASDIDKEVGKITTSLPEAYKLFIEGAEYEDKGDIRKAISYYEKAVAIDPEFATAYLSIGIAYWKIGLYSEEKRYYEKALELSDRISDRERYLVEAEYYLRTERTYGRAIELFEKLLEIYPDDSWGNNDFGWLYNQIEEWDKSIERLEVNIHNKDLSPMSYTVISSSYRAKGLYDRTQEVLESYLNSFPDNMYIHHSLGINYLCQGKYDLALLEADKAIFLNPDSYINLFLKGSIYLFKEDLEKAEKEYLNLLEQKEPIAQVWGLLGLSKLYLSQGRFKKSKNQLKRGIELAEDSSQTRWKTWFYYNLAMISLGLENPESALKELNEAWKTAIKEEDLSSQRSILHAKGLAHLKMKLIEETKSEAIELKEMIEKGLNKNAIRLYFHLAGMIELEGGNFSEAIDYFKKAISLLPFQNEYFDEHAFFIESLASAYIQLGNLENALAEYERITALTTGRLPFGDVYAKSFYMLGKIYEEKGWKGKAIEHYEKFLSLWKDADPGIAEVEDAKKRLAGLKS